MKKRVQKRNKKSTSYTILNILVFVLILSSIFFIPLASVYTETHASVISQVPNKKINVAVIGDSIANGGDASSLKKSFPYEFDALLTMKNIDTSLNVISIPGITVGSMRDYLEANTDKIPKNSDLVIIELGTNDYFHDTSSDDFIKQYKDLLQKISLNSPNAMYLCLNTWQPANHNVYNELIAEVCPGQVVDINSLFPNTSYRGPVGSIMIYGKRDYFHPNDRGHAAITQEIYNTLTLTSFKYFNYLEQ